MKKILFLFTMLISFAICQAIPPPDIGPGVQYEQVYADFDQPCADFAVYELAVQPPVVTGVENEYKVENLYLFNVSDYAEKYKEALMLKCKLALLTGNTDESWNRYKPPLTTWSNGSFGKRPIDLQNRNYGYPLTAN